MRGHGGRPAAEGPVVGLEKLDVSTVGRGGHSDNKVVYIGEDRSLIYYWVEWGDIDDEQ